MPRVAQFLVLGLLAQASPKFEVASIKMSPPGVQTTLYYYPGGRFAAKKATLKTLIKFAYGVSDRQILGGPEWLDRDRFDIEATPEKDAGAEQVKKDRQIKLMLQDLLADRFQLEVKHETRELPVYALMVSKGGSKLVANTGKPFGITRRGVEKTRRSTGRRFLFERVSMSRLAAELSGQIGGDDLDRNVVDRTGLTGDFDFTLAWSLVSTRPTDDDGPSIFSAVQSQLGLNLKADKGDVEVIRVTRADKPSEN